MGGCLEEGVGGSCADEEETVKECAILGTLHCRFNASIGHGFCCEFSVRC